MINSIINLVGSSIKSGGGDSGPVTIIADAFRLTGCSSVVIMVASILAANPLFARVEWELISGPVVTPLTSDGIAPNPPLNATDPTYMWQYPSAVREDRVFRLWVNKGGVFQDYLDIEVSAVPRSIYSHKPIYTGVAEKSTLTIMSMVNPPRNVRNLILVAGKPLTTYSTIVPADRFYASWLAPLYLVDATSLKVSIQDPYILYDTLATNKLISDTTWDYTTQLQPGKILRVTTTVTGDVDEYTDALVSDVLPTNVLWGSVESTYSHKTIKTEVLGKTNLTIASYELLTLNNVSTPALESTYSHKIIKTEVLGSTNLTVYDYALLTLNNIVTPNLESTYTHKLIRTEVGNYYVITLTDFGLGSLG